MQLFREQVFDKSTNHRRIATGQRDGLVHLALDSCAPVGIGEA